MNLFRQLIDKFRRAQAMAHIKERQQRFTDILTDKRMNSLAPIFARINQGDPTLLDEEILCAYFPLSDRSRLLQRQQFLRLNRLHLSLRNISLRLPFYLRLSFARLIAFSRTRSLYNRLAQASEHVCVTVFLAMNFCLLIPNLDNPQITTHNGVFV